MRRHACFAEMLRAHAAAAAADAAVMMYYADDVCHAALFHTLLLPLVSHIN